MKEVMRREVGGPSPRKIQRGGNQVSKDAVLKFIHLRYHPPGLILQYLDYQGSVKEKVVELLDLNYASSVSKFSAEILKMEPLLFSTRNQRKALAGALDKLREKCLHDYGKRFVKQYSFYPHTSPVTQMCLSKDGKQFITTSSSDNTASVWDLGAMKEMVILYGHRREITSISLSHFADKALTASEDGTIRLWDISRLAAPAALPSPNSNAADSNCQVKLVVTKRKVGCAAPSFDFTMAASGCSDGSAYVHDLANGIAMYKFADAHSQEITNIQFDTSGTTLLTSSTDGTAALWDLRSGSLTSLLDGHGSEIVECLFDHLCQTVATCSTDTKVRLWDVRVVGGGGRRPSTASTYSTRNPRLLYEFTENEHEVHSIHFDSRGAYLASGSLGGWLTAWNLKTGKLLFQAQNECEYPIRKVQWSPNGALLMTVGDDKSVNLYHPDMATCIQTLSHHKDSVTNAFFSYSNDYLVTAGQDRNVVVYRLEKPLNNGPFVLSQCNNMALRNYGLSPR